MLISLIIKERENLLPDKTFFKKNQGKNQENRLRKHFIQEKKIFTKTLDNDNSNFLDFSGGILGI
jgi:hypothetical protein